MKDEKELLKHANRILDNYSQLGLGAPEESTDHAVACAVAVRYLLTDNFLKDKRIEDLQTAIEAFRQYDGDEDLWAMLIRERDDLMHKAIEHGAARYHPTTGEFEWIDRETGESE